MANITLPKTSNLYQEWHKGYTDFYKGTKDYRRALSAPLYSGGLYNSYGYPQGGQSGQGSTVPIPLYTSYTYSNLESFLDKKIADAGAIDSKYWDSLQNTKDDILKRYNYEYTQTLHGYGGQGLTTTSPNNWVASFGAFEDTLNTAVTQRKATEEAHARQMAQLEQERKAAEARQARAEAWGKNLPTQGRKTENLPEVVRGGGAGDDELESVGISGGGKRRRGRGLSSTLGVAL